MKKIKEIVVREYKALLIWIGINLAVFLLSVILDHAAPVCNVKLQFPDRVYDLLYLYPWQEELYSNLFLMVSLVFPFFFLYRRMMDVAGMVFGLRNENTGRTGRGKLLFHKLGPVVLKPLVICLALFAESAIFFLLEGNRLLPGLALEYFFRLFLVSLAYMALALFAAACAEEIGACEDMSLVFLLLPYVMARLHSLIRFFSDQVTASHKKLSDPELVETWIHRLTSLQVLSPAAWCTPGIGYPVWYAVCAAVISVILAVAAISMLMDVRETGR